MQGKYDPDEALRITSVSAMFEGHTYHFRVRNTEGTFMVMMEEHELPRGYFEKPAFCPHKKDPCTAVRAKLKDAIRESIAQHNTRMHRLVLVK